MPPLYQLPMFFMTIYSATRPRRCAKYHDHGALLTPTPILGSQGHVPPPGQILQHPKHLIYLEIKVRQCGMTLSAVAFKQSIRRAQMLFTRILSKCAGKRSSGHIGDGSGIRCN
jgi:hypothetical protein